MKLSVKFSGAVLLVLAASLGATAWLVIRHQARSLQQLPFRIQRFQAFL